MAENKRITLDWDTSGLTVYCIIRREADNFRLNDADGAFAVNPADPYIDLTEDVVIKGRYELNESRTVWTDGLYTVAIYSQAGGSPVPTSDTIIGTGPAYWSIKDDLEVYLSSFVVTLAEIWSYATRSLTDKLGFFISGTKTTLDDLNDLSVGDITGEVQTGVFARVAVTGDAIQIIEGNFKTLSIDLGAEWDLTDKFVYFVMSAQGSSVAPIVNREVDRITDAPNGLAEIDLLPTETTPEGCYEYQVEIRNDPADDEPETAMEGTAEITENLRSQ